MDESASNSASTNGGPGHQHGGPTSNGVAGDRETASVSPPTISAGSVSAASAAAVQQAAASVHTSGLTGSNNPLQNPSKLYEEAAAATAAAAGLTSLGSHLHSASSYMNMSQAYPYSMMGNGGPGAGGPVVGQMENSVVTSSCSANPASGGYSYSPASNMSPSCMSMNNGQPPQATTPTGKKNLLASTYLGLSWHIFSYYLSCL